MRNKDHNHSSRVILEPKVLVFGKLIIDTVPSRQCGRTIGGGGSQACLGVTLGHGHSCLLAVVGTDVMRDDTLTMQLQATGADMSKLIVRPEIKTPRYVITYDANEKPAFEEAAGFEFWDTILEMDMMPHLDLAEYKNVEVLHVLVEHGGHSELRTALQLYKSKYPSAILSFEPIIIQNSPQHLYELIPPYLVHGHVVSPDLHTALRVAQLPLSTTEPDHKLLFALKDKWLGYGPSVTVVRNGASGSYVFTKIDPLVVHHVPVVANVKFIDATGAGNAFAAAFSTALVATQGCRVEKWSRKCILWAASVATVIGARVVETEGLPVASSKLRDDVWRDAKDVFSRISPIVLSAGDGNGGGK